MDAIFGLGSPGSNTRYYDEVNGISLHEALIAAINSFEGSGAADTKEVILDRFGLIDGKLKTLQEVGRALMLSDSQAARLELSGLRRLRHPSRSSKLKIYIK